MKRTRLAHVLLLAMLAVYLGDDRARAQRSRDVIPPAKLIGESQRAAVRLATALAHVEKGQWSEAVEAYQSLLEEAGDDLIAIDSRQPGHCMAVRRLCQVYLAALPAPALRLYRARIDPPAQKLFDQAASNRDVTLLRHLAEDYFVSRHAERAVDLLGDLAFERGDFHEAEHWWRLLALPCSEVQEGKDKAGDALRLLYPDPQGDLALVRAKQILALLFRGDRRQGLEELKRFRVQHPNSSRPLAGRSGKYADILQALADQKDLAPPPDNDHSWPTFAGSPTRSGIAPQVPRCRWLEETWRVRLDGQQAEQGKQDGPPVGSVLNAHQANLALAFYPVIVGDQVVLADARYITAYDLLSGKRRARFDLLANVNQGVPRTEVAIPVKHDERFTLTVAENRVYARLGGTALPRTSNEGGKHANLDSYLVCLDLQAQANPWMPRWQVPARTQPQEIALFEGSPVVAGRRVYVAWTRFDRNLAATAIDCYDAGTGQRRWRQEICEANELAENGEPRYRQHLLTLAGPNVVYCSHSGAVVALDGLSGKRTWAVRYPRRGYRLQDGNLSPRDLAPCVYVDGRLYVAPADADRILCLDALTGRLLWESKPLEVMHLLGVARGKLIFTTGSTPRGLRALDARTGNDLRSWVQPEDGQGELPSRGRGILAGDSVLWPTMRDGLRILNLDDGRVSDKHFLPPGSVRSGNLAIGNGCVVTATDRELIGYVPPGRLLQQRRKAAAENPQSAEAIYHLALAEADAEVTDLAAKHLEAAWQILQNSAEPDASLRQRIMRRARQLTALEPRLVPHQGLSQTYPTLPPPGRMLAFEGGAIPLAADQPSSGTGLQQVWAVRNGSQLEGEKRQQRLVPLAPHSILAIVQQGYLVYRETWMANRFWAAGATGPVCWVSRHENSLFVGGPLSISSRRLEDGSRPIWEMVAPDWTLYGWEPLGFGPFTLAQPRLFVLEDARRLCAVDVETGKLLWFRWAPAAHVRPLEPAGKFHPLYYADKNRVLIQTSLGHTWLLDSKTGRKIREIASQGSTWLQAPLPLDEQRVCLVPDGQHITLLDLISGQTIWTYTIDRKNSLSGEAPQVAGTGDCLLVCVPRNYGYDLQCLDVRSGESRWAKPVLLQQPLNLEAAALDDRSVYLTLGNRLEAIGLPNGMSLWQLPLPGPAGSWRVIRTKNGLLVHPAEAVVQVDAGFLVRRYLPDDGAALVPTLAPWSLGRVLPGSIWAVSRANAPSRLPLLLVDPANGKVLQQLSFEGQGPQAGVAVFDKHVTVVVGDRAWGLK